MTATLTPIRRLQNEVHLARANEVRLRRACEKRAIGMLPRLEGNAQVACLLLNPPSWLDTLQVGELLTWPQRVGAIAARKMLGVLVINERKPVGELTERQRRRLAAAVMKERPLAELGWGFE